MYAPSQNLSSGAEIAARTRELFKEQQQSIISHTDRLIGRLMFWQWGAGVAAALLISPQTWSGSHSRLHPHLIAAVLLGGILTALPVFLASKQPGHTPTRYTIAVAQMLMSALLIHLTGGRIETHFHVFGSLAILAFYRDWRVLAAATTVVIADHLLRGLFWPQSVYGVLTAPITRSLEHGGWVIFEVTFLLVAMRKSLAEMMYTAERQARLEALNESFERKVAERTADLTRENFERQLVEYDLKQSEARLARAQQIAHMGSWEWDIQRDKVIWSAETARLYGFTSEDLGKHMERCLERVHPEDLAVVRKSLEVARAGQPFVSDHRVLLPDGTERFLHGLGEVIKNENGETIRIIGTVQDVTEAHQASKALQRSEEQLRQAQKMEAVGRLAGGVAHDFNNLLTVISGYASMSLMQMDQASPLRKHTEQIQKAAERAASLTGQLLAFSRKQVLQPQVLQLNGVVGGLEKMLRRLIGEDIELATVFDPKLGNVKADPGQIEQVIINMVVNARDAMPQGGKLTISTANVTLDQATSFRNRSLPMGEYVMFAISDTGAGMSSEVLSHVFEPFYTTKGVGRGTGLGLATCYGIVCQSHGDIRVYSEVNQGTTFKIYLPRVDAPVTPQNTDPVSNELPAGTESVLIVEDDAEVRRLSVEILAECGYQVQEACDGAAALKLINASSSFDLMITDVIMPRMSGRELFGKVKDIIPNTRVLFMSGYTDDALAQHGVLEPGLWFIEKPFSPARLARKVREVLDAAATLPTRPTLHQPTLAFESSPPAGRR
ncbi:MAG: response regulator [Verrucomicrobiota bacterium]